MESTLRLDTPGTASPWQPILEPRLRSRSAAAAATILTRKFPSLALRSASMADGHGSCPSLVRITKCSIGSVETVRVDNDSVREGRVHAVDLGVGHGNHEWLWRG